MPKRRQGLWREFLLGEDPERGAGTQRRLDHWRGRVPCPAAPDGRSAATPQPRPPPFGRQSRQLRGMNSFVNQCKAVAYMNCPHWSTLGEEDPLLSP
jgi:hypothetical protein